MLETVNGVRVRLNEHGRMSRTGAERVVASLEDKRWYRMIAPDAYFEIRKAASPDRFVVQMSNSAGEESVHFLCAAELRGLVKTYGTTVRPILAVC